MPTGSRWSWCSTSRRWRRRRPAGSLLRALRGALRALSCGTSSPCWSCPPAPSSARAPRCCNGRSGATWPRPSSSPPALRRGLGAGATTVKRHRPDSWSTCHRRRRRCAPTSRPATPSNAVPPGAGIWWSRRSGAKTPPPWCQAARLMSLASVSRGRAGPSPSRKYSLWCSSRPIVTGPCSAMSNFSSTSPIFRQTPGWITF